MVVIYWLSEESNSEKVELVKTFSIAIIKNAIRHWLFS